MLEAGFWGAVGGVALVLGALIALRRPLTARTVGLITWTHVSPWGRLRRRIDNSSVPGEGAALDQRVAREEK